MKKHCKLCKLEDYYLGILVSHFPNDKISVNAEGEGWFELEFNDELLEFTEYIFDDLLRILTVVDEIEKLKEHL